MDNFSGIPNATIYEHSKGAPKTPPQHPITTTVYGHPTGAPKTPPQHPVKATVYGRATGAPKTPQANAPDTYSRSFETNFHPYKEHQQQRKKITNQ